MKPFLKTVYSSVLKNVALRLAAAYKRYFEIDEVSHPHYRSWKKKWFSLEYEETSGWKLNNRQVTFSLGKSDSKQLKVTGMLKRKLNLHDGKAKSLRLVKENGKFYAVFTIVRTKPEKKSGDRWIALDPNHKNLFTGYDYNGNSIEFTNLTEPKHWDKVIDGLQSKRDKRKSKSIFVSTDGRRGYWKPSRRWIRYNTALKHAEHTKREQIKLAMFNIANYLCKHYDRILMGDYAPSVEVAPYKNMKRSMLNRTYIGYLRQTIEWVAEKSGKTFVKVDERNTTKECCLCGDLEKKGPEVRTFTCKQCGETLSRDINSAVNIAKKILNLSGTDYEDNLIKPSYIASWRFNKSQIRLRTN